MEPVGGLVRIQEGGGRLFILDPEPFNLMRSLFSSPLAFGALALHGDYDDGDSHND